MLTHPTLDKLQTLRLAGMYHGLVEQLQMADITAFSFEERFGLLVDRELTERDTRRLTTRLRQAKLRQTACIGSCAPTLLIIPSAQKPGKMPHLTTRWRGQCHGLTSVLLPTRSVGHHLALRPMASH